MRLSGISKLKIQPFNLVYNLLTAKKILGENSGNISLISLGVFTNCRIYLTIFLLLMLTLLCPSFLLSAWFGVQIQNYYSNSEPKRGVEIIAVAPSSPAFEANLQAGDIILSLNNSPVFHNTSLSDALQAFSSGDTISLIIWRLGKKERVLAILKDLPQDIRYHNEARLYFKRGDYKRSSEILNELIKISPKDAVAYEMRARNYIKQGRYEHAIADMTKAINLQSNTNFFNLRGWMYLEQNNYKAAIDDFSRAITIDPLIPSAYYNRGIVLREIGKSKEAYLDYSKAIELDPNFADAYINRSQIQEELGNKQASISDYNLAAEAYLERG
ncbi:MAG: tetratricopeptide repeat protein, partial [Desulfobacterales bacterium]|nr:tetratricopeptide repeat protein [Desulfobacterales bacterium]